LNIDVGYLPKHYYDEMPDAGGFFPFAYEGSASYVFTLDDHYLPDCDENFLPVWMENLKAFPLYFCAEFPSFWVEEYIENCKEFNIPYRFMSEQAESSLIITEVKDENQFRAIFPFYITLSTASFLVLWSTQKDVFRIEEREWKGNLEGKVVETVVAKLENHISLFWIGYDGDNIAVLSNHPQFSTYEKLIATFPGFVVPIQCEYE
jgi:hypothetical protein